MGVWCHCPFRPGPSGRPYAEIEWQPGSDLAGLMRTLGIKGPALAHHDPDLDEGSVRRRPGWRALFGQAEAASAHLSNQGVGCGDLFLFFGRFRRTEGDPSRGLHFIGESVNVFWGYLEVGEVRYPAQDSAPPDWAVDHPHFACSTERWFTKNNRVYVTRPNSRLISGAPGGRTFRTYRDELRLTAPASALSRWRLPLEFHPDQCGALMSNTSRKEWSTDGEHAFLQITGQRQEFVIEMMPAIQPWARGVIEAGLSIR